MYVTLNHFQQRNKIVFFHLKPTSYFLKWYINSNRVIPCLSSQKLPRIARQNLVNLL